jgi:excisionase family DNA binding protein
MNIRDHNQASDFKDIVPFTSGKRLLAPDEVAQWLGVSPGWVRDHARRKEPRMKAVKVGKLLRFRREDVEEFIRAWCE